MLRTKKTSAHTKESPSIGLHDELFGGLQFCVDTKKDEEGWVTTARDVADAQDMYEVTSSTFEAAQRAHNFALTACHKRYKDLLKDHEKALAPYKKR